MNKEADPWLKWENNAVYVSYDKGETWRLFMYFPKSTTAGLRSKGKNHEPTKPNP